MCFGLLHETTWDIWLDCSLHTLTTSANKSMIKTDSVKSNQHILSIQDIVGNNNSYINFKNECFWANLGKISSPKYISAHIYIYIYIYIFIKGKDIRVFIFCRKELIGKHKNS